MAAADPKYHEINLSTLQSLFTNPVLMTGILRDILARHLQDGLIEHPALRSAIWSGDADTAIVIESIHRWRPQTSGNRPAVVIKRNAYRFMRRGIGDRLQGNPTDRQGDEHYTAYWVGSHTLFCIGQTGAQCELLATEVQRHISQFSPKIRETLGLKRLNILEVGPVSELEEAEENFAVPVVVGYACEDSWKITQQAPPLSRLSLTTLLDC